MSRKRSISKPGSVLGLFVAAVLVFGTAPIAVADLDYFDRPDPLTLAECPEWLKADAPFDVEAFYAMPDEGNNAAPLYPYALEEFDRSIHPDRSERLYELMTGLDSHPILMDREFADALLDELDDGFLKLAVAQWRPLCVFTIDHPYRMQEAARAVARATRVRVFRDVERGELDRPIRDVAMCLRLSRDSRLRGRDFTQIFSMAIDNAVWSEILPLLVGSPLFEVEHCDRLLSLLREHEELGLDRYATGERTNYITRRVALRLFQDKRRLSVDADGRIGEVEVDPGYLALKFLRITDSETWSVPEAAVKANAEWMGRAAAALREHEPLWEQERRAFEDFYRIAVSTRASGYAERVGALREASAKWLGDKENPSPLWLARALVMGFPYEDRYDPEFAIRAFERSDAHLRSWKCLIALRRWRLSRPDAGEPPSLDEACRAAGLPGTPIDPFSGEALKSITVDGRVVVYSIGPDGVDDQGRKDARHMTDWEGDFVFPMAEVAAWPPLPKK